MNRLYRFPPRLREFFSHGLSNQVGRRQSSTHREPQRSRIGLYAGCLIVANSALFIHYAHTSHIAVSRTYGPSMLPTIQAEGDWVIISKWYRYGQGVRINDLISFRHPTEGHFAIKRVIADEGDFVVRRTVDLKDLYVIETGDIHMVQIPQGHIWVEGDNRSSSKDSRLYGPLPKSLIDGKVLGVFRPNPLWWIYGTKLDLEDEAGFRGLD